MRNCVLLFVALGCLGLRADVPTPWLRHRISRNWRTPINRPPLNHDELLDDTDYYPDGYLAEMARDGVNGLWVSAELDQLSGSEKRLAKLRTTARKAARHGIGIWLMFNDPIAVRADDPRVTAHPEMFGPGPKWDEGMRLWCPSEPKTLAYVRDRTAVVFKAVPELAGIINIAHGEGMTTCLSNLNGCDVDYEEGIFCPRCATRAPWELMADVAAAYVAGMRAGNPKAELLSWAYQASAKTERRAWVPDLARHQPDGSTLVYNFESGCVKEQLGRRHVGGDYWLSVAGPGAPFASVAAAARDAKAPLAAKIQVATSHEMATLPYVPAPGLLYRKYRAMRTAGVTSVLQCWYFGNMPGVMNKAAGWLASVDFAKEDERAFLRRLAADDWGADAPVLERIWSAFTEAYEDYPLDNSMQYYGPFAAGVAWPLSVRPELKPLARTWIPTDAVSGDFIGECLKDFTLDEAETLTARMAARCETVRADLDALAAKCAGNPARTRDIGVMKAFRNQILAAHDVFAFYKARRDGDRAAMVRLATDELKVTDEMIALSEADDRLGWHSEAEARLYSPELLRARRAALEEIVRTGAAAPAGRVPDAFFGCETVGSNIVWTATMEGADCVVRGTVRDVPGLVVSATDAFGTVCPQTRHVAVTNGAFTVRFGKFRPGRLLFLADTYPQRLYAEVLWPQGKPKVLNRLRLPWSHGPSSGTIGMSAKDCSVALPLSADVVRIRPGDSVRAKLDEARSLRHRGSEPVEVRFAAGDHVLDGPLRLGPADSGLFLVGEKGARLTRSVACTPGARLSGDFPPLPTAECFGTPAPHEPMFFYDHTWAVEARWPNAGWATFTNVVCTGLNGGELGGCCPQNKPSPGAFVIESDRPCRWDFDEGVWICGYFTHDWAFERIRAASFCVSNRVLRLAAPATFGVGGSSWGAGSARRFFVTGVRAELDEPGECYFDRRTKTVEFLTPAGMREFRVVAKPGPVVAIVGATNVVLRGLDVEYAVGAGVSVAGGEGVRIERCRIRNVGGCGVTISGGARCTVRECEIDGTGLHGVDLSGGDRAKLVAGGHAVERSSIARFGKIRHTYAVGVHLGGCGNRVVGNRIFDAPHTAVLYSGNDHLMADNEVWNVLCECFDAGAFYTGRDPTSRGNVLRGNYVHDVGRRGDGAGTMAFYLDDCDAGDTLVSNRVVNVARGLMIGGGQDNHVIGNSFADCDIGISLDDRGVTWTKHWDNPNDRSWQMTRKVKEMHVDEEPWRSRYPLLADYLRNAPREPRHVSIVGNVFEKCDRDLILPEKVDRYRPHLDIRDNRTLP